MAKVEFVVPSVLNRGQGEKKIPLEASDLQDAFSKISEQMGDDFKRRVFDHNGRPRSLINIYVNGKIAGDVAPAAEPERRPGAHHTGADHDKRRAPALLKAGDARRNRL